MDLRKKNQKSSLANFQYFVYWLTCNWVIEIPGFLCLKPWNNNNQMLQDWDGMELNGKLLINLCKTLGSVPRMHTYANTQIWRFDFGQLLHGVWKFLLFLLFGEIKPLCISFLLSYFYVSIQFFEIFLTVFLLCYLTGGQSFFSWVKFSSLLVYFFFESQ